MDIQTNCCIVGGGPAGIILGYLFAKSGINVTVLEKHQDFFRDFRGDTVHPSTLQLIDQMGLLNDFLKLPHQKVTKFENITENSRIVFADFSTLKVSTPYIVMMPQWDLLNFFTTQAQRYPNFKLLMHTEAVDYIDTKANNLIIAIDKNSNTKINISSKLVIAADGRHSTIRELSKLKIDNYGAPIDVLWFKLSKKNSDPEQTAARFVPGNIIVMINRRDYWQCAYIIPKNGLENLQKQGLENFKKTLLSNANFLIDRLAEIQSWEQIKLLTVKVDRLQQWHKSNKLLCIGDAAHAMSPIGGVGINLAVQDAVATYNNLKQNLLNNDITEDNLKKIQKRREFAVKLTQRIQLAMHNQVIYKVLADDKNTKEYTPIPIRVIKAFPFLNRLIAKIIGIGIRPERLNN